MSAVNNDSPITSTPGPTRKSVGGSRKSLRQSFFQKTLSREEQAHNDDDEERSSLVASERSVTTPATGGSRDNSISLTPQKEHYQGCLKLYAENKITKDNAWNLQLIDFMTSMLRRNDRRMDNLQTASTVVDASTRIYAFRVDAVHHDVLLMAGGLTRAVHTKRGKKDDAAGEAAPGEAGPGRRRRRARGAVAGPAQLAGDFDTEISIDPFFERLAATAGDVTASNRAFNATLPVNDDTLSLELRTDVPLLRGAAAGGAERGAERGAARVALPARLLPAFAAPDRVCEPFTGFSIAHWDREAEERGCDELDLSQQAVAFDVLADVEPVPEDEPWGAAEAGLDSGDECDVAVAACVARAAPAPPARLLDMRPAAPQHARLEYSYCAVRAWAGPAHWRLKHNRASQSQTAGCSGGAGGAQAAARAARARRPLQFSAEATAAGADCEPAPPAKIMISRKTLATGPAWNEANYRTPVDRGLDASFFRRLFLRRPLPAPAPAPPAPPPADAHYDYDNENDASYCPLPAQDGDEWGPAEGDAGVAAAAGDAAFDMLEPPAKVPKLFIPYAARAKKVDMKQLKQLSWRLLADEREQVAPSSLFQVYGGLARRLPPEARESLSVPLALLAVLHLANERGLRLQPRADLRDVGVLGLL